MLSGLKENKECLLVINNKCSQAYFFLALLPSDRSRKEHWLSNHIYLYQCPSLVKLRQTLARRYSELAFLRGKNIHLLLTAAHTQACKLGLFFFFSLALSWINVLLPCSLKLHSLCMQTQGMISQLQSLSKVTNNLECSPGTFYLLWSTVTAEWWQPGHSSLSPNKLGLLLFFPPNFQIFVPSDVAAW